jgi:hypothetical protein
VNFRGIFLPIGENIMLPDKFEQLLKKQKPTG